MCPLCAYDIEEAKRISIRNFEKKGDIGRWKQEIRQ